MRTADPLSATSSTLDDSFDTILEKKWHRLASAKNERKLLRRQALCRLDTKRAIIGDADNALLRTCGARTLESTSVLLSISSAFLEIKTYPRLKQRLRRQRNDSHLSSPSRRSSMTCVGRRRRRWIASESRSRAHTTHPSFSLDNEVTNEHPPCARVADIENLQRENFLCSRRRPRTRMASRIARGRAASAAADEEDPGRTPFVAKPGGNALFVV